MKTIVGIDPGSRFLGLCIARVDDNVHIDSVQRITYNQKDDIFTRQSQIRESLYFALKDTKIDVAILETPFFGRNIKVAITLGEIRGIILCELLRNNKNVEIINLAPAQVRACFGKKTKGDSKTDYQDIVLSLYKLHNRCIKEDAADAVAIMHAGLLKIKN